MGYVDSLGPQRRPTIRDWRLRKGVRGAVSAASARAACSSAGRARRLPRMASLSRTGRCVGALGSLLAVAGGCGGAASSSPEPEGAPVREPLAPHADPSGPPEPREDLLSTYSGKVYGVEELLQAQLQPGAYVIDAYVISVFICGPCPPDAECEQCLNDHVVLADQPELLEGYGRGRSDLLILEPPPQEMLEQRRYRLRIQLHDPSAGPVYETISTKGWVEAFVPLGE
jgi:hypothetical protein